MNLDDSVVVVGAGLAGSMMALMLARKGFNVVLYEKREDFRVAERMEAEAVSHLGNSKDATKRSINLALSHRGQSALEAVGLLDVVMAGVVPMPCRAIHPPAGGIVTQPYGKPGQAIYSASRALLNRTLLDACDKLPNVRTCFEAVIKRIDAEGNLTVEEKTPGGAPVTRTFRPRLIVGSDGAYSAVREALLRHSRADFSRTYIEHGYKELNMPPVGEGFCMPTPNALHIWPRHKFMMIALPNPDHTFTCTLFMPWADLEKLDANPSSARAFFEEHFPDALPHIPEIEKQVATHPSGALVMTKTNPWNLGDRIVLIGDAAHSVVPFYGQGANAAFEDCLVFSETLDACGGNLSEAVKRFAKERKPAGDALAKLSLDNYVEMRHKTASRWFLFRKRVEGVLQALMPTTWIPQYSMVAFTRIPYHTVIERAERQERILDIATTAVAATVGAAVAYAGWKTLSRNPEAVAALKARSGSLLAAVLGSGAAKK